VNVQITVDTERLLTVWTYIHLQNGSTDNIDTHTLQADICGVDFTLKSVVHMFKYCSLLKEG